MDKQPVQEAQHAADGETPVERMPAGPMASPNAGPAKHDEAPVNPPERLKTTPALLDNADKLIGLVIAILTSMLVVADDVFRITFWALIILGVILYLIYFRKTLTVKRGLMLVVTVPVLALIAYALHDYVTQPRFTLRIADSRQTITTQRILWFTYTWPPFAQVEPFEITDNLLDGAYVASLPKEERDRRNQEAKEKTGQGAGLPAFTDGMRISIAPEYKGTKPIHKVELRISGKNKQNALKVPVWESITANPSQGEVDIAIPDLMKISQIARGVDALETNLNLEARPFPEAEITLELIDEMNPDQPLSSPINVKIQNGPWLQYATTAHRPDGVYIDYYLKNLGRDGEFRYQVNITKIIDEVSEKSTHPIWSGTTTIDSFQGKEKFWLKTGESKQLSIPIRPLDKGRYVIEIFAIKRQDRVRLDAPATWDGFDEDYFYATPGTVMLLISCNDVGKDCYRSTILPIEKLSPSPEVFDGQVEQMGGQVTKLYVTPYTVLGEEQRFANWYTLGYSVDPQKEGYAGMDLYFDEPTQDLSSYQRVRMQIQFSNENTTMMFRMASRDGGTEKKYEVIMGDGRYGKSSTGKQSIEIPLSLFKDNGIDLSKVAYIAFVAHQRNLPNDGQQTFSVGQIEFLR